MHRVVAVAKKFGFGANVPREQRVTGNRQRLTNSSTLVRSLGIVAVVLAMVSVGQVALAAPDVDAPTWPIGREIVVNGVTSTTASLSWTAAEDDVGVTGYRLYDGGAEIATSAGPSTVLSNLDPGTDYDIRVEAFDAAGNESASGGGLALGPRIDVYAGEGLHSVKGVDVNHDGDLDLVAAAANDDGISILLGNGDGTFGSRTVYRSGTESSAVLPKNAVLANLNGGNDLDLVTANQNTSSIGILLGNGDGTFGTALELPTCGLTHDVTAGHFNADAFVDVAAVCQSAPLMTIWFGNGDGTFTGRVDVPTNESATCATGTPGPPVTPGDRCAHGIATGDLNGPGNDDIAIAAYGGVTATVLLGNGDGTFATPAPYGVAGNPHDIAIGDFDDDGNQDLVTANESADNISVLLGSSGGSFTDAGTRSAASEPKGVTTGDLDGDLIPDIAVASGARNYPDQNGNAGDFITIWLSDGDGTFSLGGTFGDFSAAESASLFDIAIADLNGDGVNDVAAAGWHSGNVSLFFGASSGGPSTSFTTDDDPPVAVDDGPYPVEFGGTVSITVPGVLGNDTDDGSALTAVKASNPSHGSATLNEDGSFSYTHSGDSATSDSFTYRAKDSGGQTSNVATVTFTIGTEPVPGHSVGLVDPTSGKWHLYDGSGGLLTSFFFGNPGDYPFMGDWDGDGVETPGLYRQSDGFVYIKNANTQGVADISFFFGNPGDVTIAGDFNNDGFDTVSIYRPSNQTFYIINELGADGGGLGAAEFSYVFGDPGDQPFVGDFDGDGTETVGLHRESTGLVYFLNDHIQGNADNQFIFGDPGDRLVAGDWTDDGVFTPALFRPSNTTMFFRYTNSQGIADNQWAAGQSAWLPVSGDT